jgi:ABC-type transporter Mla MlaB component
MPVLTSAFAAEPTPTLTLRGSLDEGVNLSVLTRGLAPGPLAVELAGIDRISSNGVAIWVRWMEELEARGVAVQLRSVSPVLVAQLNSIRGFAGRKGRVVSVCAPFVCDACGSEAQPVVEVGEAAPQLPSVTCATCGQPMTFDDLEAHFFGFLAELSARSG